MRKRETEVTESSSHNNDKDVKNLLQIKKIFFLIIFSSSFLSSHVHSDKKKGGGYLRRKKALEEETSGAGIFMKPQVESLHFRRHIRPTLAHLFPSTAPRLEARAVVVALHTCGAFSAQAQKQALLSVF